MFASRLLVGHRCRVGTGEGTCRLSFRYPRVVEPALLRYLLIRLMLSICQNINGTRPAANTSEDSYG